MSNQENSVVDVAVEDPEQVNTAGSMSHETVDGIASVVVLLCLVAIAATFISGG